MDIEKIEEDLKDTKNIRDNYESCSEKIRDFYENKELIENLLNLGLSECSNVFLENTHKIMKNIEKEVDRVKRDLLFRERVITENYASIKFNLFIGDIVEYTDHNDKIRILIIDDFYYSGSNSLVVSGRRFLKNNKVGKREGYFIVESNGWKKLEENI